MTDKPTITTLEQALRINRAMRRQIETMLDTPKKPAQQTVRARMAKVVKAARSLGIDPKSVTIDGVTVSAAQPTPEDKAMRAYDKWKAKKNARQA
jgi:hypothetical protein